MKAQLTITITDAGEINVSGPINDKLLSYGMLELARDAIQAHIEKAKSGLVIAPAGSVPPSHSH